jgi:hypothetical protein
MIDDDMHRLEQRALDRSLSGLEADIWKGVAFREQRRKAVRRTASWQGLIMVCAVVGSIVVGIEIAAPATAAAGASPLAPGMELMPSNLLVAHSP